MEIQTWVDELFDKPVEITGQITLQGDASSRRYHRIELGAGVEPTSLIVMELPPDALGSDELTAGGAPTELPFLNIGRYLADAGLPVPRVYLDAVERGALLLEDLGDETFAGRVHSGDEAAMAEWYGAAVELLAELHRALWPIPAGCQARERGFDFELLRWELDHYREWGAEALLDRPLDRALRQRLDRAFDDLATEIAQLPRGFVHRDYQSRNLMVVGERAAPDSLVIIDFQDALEGPRVYDLVALLNDSYVDVQPALQERIVGRYAELAGLDGAALLDEFRLVTVQRKLKDGGRFVFIDRVKGNPSFLPYVDASFGRVRRALAALPGHAELKSVLAEVDPARFG